MPKHGYARGAATGNRGGTKAGGKHSKLGRDPMGRSEPGKVYQEGGAKDASHGALGGLREGDTRPNKPSAAGTKIP